MFELTVLGLPHLRQGTTYLPIRPNRLMFLSFLALEGPVDRGTLAACFWEGFDPAVARSRLRLELHRVRQSALGAALSVTGESVQLNVVCDAVQAREAYAAREWERVAAAYRGEFLATLAVDMPMLQGWLESCRATFARQFEGALQQLVAAADRNGDSEDALRYHSRLLELNPYSDEICRDVVARLRRLGRPDEALACETRYRARAVADLGLSLPATALPVHPPVHPGVVSNRPLPSSEPPLVGREILWAKLDAWTQSPSPMLLLIGEGGVGKSRLATEWCRRQEKPALTVQGVELGRGVPYYAIGEALRHVDPAVFGALKPVWKAELAALWPDLFPESAAGHPSSPLRLLEALAEALRAAMPETLLVLEDFHWIDAASIHVLAHALNRWQTRGEAPRLLVTARPGELAEQDPALSWLAELEREGRAQRLVVPPLSQGAVLELIRHLSGSHQATRFARRLHALSGGNIYALLAFLQGLEDQGVLERPPEGTWRLTVNQEELEQYLTPTLREALCLGIERHGTASLRWLEAASLLTPPFDFDTVWDGSGLDESAALSVLELALKHRWIVAAESTGYRLGHDLLRHALQAQLRPERAIRVHRKLAQHLAATGGHVAELARHLEAAGDLQAAYPQWREAARQAARHWAHDEALNFLSRAIACTSDPTLQLEGLLQRCVHHKALNDLDAWGQELDVVETLLASYAAHPAFQPHVAEAQLKCIRQRAHLLLRAGQVDEALTLSDGWTVDDLSEEKIALLHDRGAILHSLDRPHEAAQLLRLLLGRLEPGQLKAKANLHNALALAVADAGQLEEGFEHAEQAIALFGELHTSGEPYMKEGLACAYGNQASLYEQLGDAQAEFKALEMAVQHAAEASNVYIQRQCLEAICEVTEKLGEWLVGIEYATKGLELCEEALDTSGTELFNGWIGRLRRVRSMQGDNGQSGALVPHYPSSRRHNETR
ncbi:AAA family ATPase [Deinococcus sp. D7000]|nr:AAA family ATPase [Deinococcus sp. D7000]